MAWLRQRDGVTCGPSVAVMAGTLLDADYGEPLRQQRARQWFDSEQRRVHRSVNMVWPRALGTTPAGMARALNTHAAARGIRYRWRPAVRRDTLADVCAAVSDGWPVAMLIGSALPRHWVLPVDHLGGGAATATTRLPRFAAWPELGQQLGGARVAAPPAGV